LVRAILDTEEEMGTAVGFDELQQSGRDNIVVGSATCLALLAASRQ